MRPLSRRVPATVALALALVAGATACGGSAGSTDSAAPAATGGCTVAVGTTMGRKPTVNVPSCPAPGALQTTDVVPGSGPAAKAGDSVLVQYVGISWSTRQQFDASWDDGGQPFAVAPLGQASVIDGWNQGLVGVKAGGRRLLVIPAALGYGPAGSPPRIKGNETLVFVVDVVSINQ